MNINNFQKGATITRIKPSKGDADYSYIGDKLTFVAIQNGLIYLKSKEFGNVEVEANRFSSGWAEYIEVDLSDFDESENFIEDFRKLVAKLLKAEDYESLAELKNILNKTT